MANDKKFQAFMNKKGMDFSINFIIGFVLILIVVAVIGLWLYFGDDGGIKGRLVNYVNANIVKKLSG